MGNLWSNKPVPALNRHRCTGPKARPAATEGRNPGMRLAGAATFLALLLSPPLARAQGTPDYELPPIEYSTRTATNRISRSLEAMHAARPAGATGTQLLRWLLDFHAVPVESQVLVFSKTSLQRDGIQPRRPRAIYFNDDLYVGWVAGGLMEVTVTDPDLGLAFYSLDGRSPSRPLALNRDGDCLSCHGGGMTRNWPGLMIRSVFPDPNGEPITSAGGFLVGHDTPLEQRWGGWYVTGRHGDSRHMGNAFAKPPVGAAPAAMDREAGANLTSLEKFFPADMHLRADSDIVALMVLEHQILVHNRLTEGALRVRKWSHYQRQLQKELGEPVSEEPTGTALRVVNGETERIVEALLFCDEAPLPEGGIGGAGDFERAFATRRKADAANRSLRDFDLRTRLFTHRCSYMVYSEAFASLPPELSSRVLKRLDEILAAANPPAKYRHLGTPEREAIRTILRETLPAYAAIAGERSMANAAAD